jgi:hypothetical protein
MTANMQTKKRVNNILNYLCTKNDANFLSMGCDTHKHYINSKKELPISPFVYGQCKDGGNYRFPNPNDLYNFILNSKWAMKYCFAELKTEYFKLFYDLDIDQDVLDYLTEHTENFNMDQFWNYLIRFIIIGLKYYIDDDEQTFGYIFSDRLDKNYKLHLYFPNIILHGPFALTIRYKIINLILEDGSYNLTFEHLNKIFDSCVYEANGIRLLFQVKKDEMLGYEINFKKSTYLRNLRKTKRDVYDNIRNDRVEQLKTVSIRTLETDTNFWLTYNNENFPLLYVDADDYADKFLRNKGSKGNKNNGQNNIKNYKIKDEAFKLKYDKQKNKIFDLLNNLSKVRLSAYETWSKVVFLCKNYIKNGNPEMREVAHNISKNGDGYTYQSVENIINSNDNDTDKLTIGSLIMWSKEDNPEKHKEILKKYSFKPLKYGHTDETLLKYRDKYFESQEQYFEENCYRTSEIAKDMLVDLALNGVPRAPDPDEDDQIDECTCGECIQCIDRPKIINRMDGLEDDDCTRDSIDGIKIIKPGDNITLEDDNKTLILDGKACILLHNQTGNGKTFMTNLLVSEKIKQLGGSDASVLSVVSRRSMVDTHITGLKDLNMTSYLKDKPNKNRYIVSLERLGKTKKNYDILILDEITSLLTHFYSKTMNDRRYLALCRLIKLIEYASLVVCADAIVTDMVISFLTKIRNDIFYYRNRFKNKKNVRLNAYYIITDKTKLDDRIITFFKETSEDVKNNKSLLYLFPQLSGLNNKLFG